MFIKYDDDNDGMTRAVYLLSTYQFVSRCLVTASVSVITLGSRGLPDASQMKTTVVVIH